MLEIYFPLCAADPIRWQRRTIKIPGDNQKGNFK